MGKGLSPLQRTILGMCSTTERDDGILMVQAIYNKLCPEFDPFSVVLPENSNRKVIASTMLGMAACGVHIGSTQWNSVRATAHEVPGLREMMAAKEQHDRHYHHTRPVVEASISRAITRLEQRGLIVRTIMGAYDEQGCRVGPQTRGIKLMVKPVKVNRYECREQQHVAA